MRITTVNVAERVIDVIDELVKCGNFSSRSEFIRQALKHFLNTEYYYIKDLEAIIGDS